MITLQKYKFSLANFREVLELHTTLRSVFLACHATYESKLHEADHPFQDAVRPHDLLAIDLRGIFRL